ncbi:hypothetical protein [Caulobacter henricii]|uniref:Lipoprotein n=1 Tax=Caulobacter henricii TaxID=69395 RepID=A0A0P0NXJ8_9CAUL|nr:hypothetical protein [Caulobacter henricii]ALL12807.1 hypothetical protein AQ619_05245 [Caulobacter henricii]
MRKRFGASLMLLAMTACRAPEPLTKDDPPVAEAAPLKPGLVMLSEAFAVVSPEGFSLSKPDKQMDFDIYEVRKGATPYVKIYVGNFPTFPTEGEERAAPSKPIVRDSARITHPSGLTTEEFLLPTTSKDWPRAIHVWALEVPGDQEVANRIASGITAR